MLEENKFYLLGIGGISMSALARILKSQGKEVCGSDASMTEMTERLEEEGIEVVQESSEKFVRECDVCVVSAAISPLHPDLVLARKLGKKIMSRSQLLGQLAREKKCISVAGTHGKTTTTAMIATVMLKAGLDPTIHIGGILQELGSNLHIGKGEYFLTEACEYKDAFLSLQSDISVILNVESDHMDYFKTMDNLRSSFKKFAKNTKKYGFCVINNQIIEEFSKDLNVLPYAIEGDALVQARSLKEFDRGRFCYDLYVADEFVEKIHLTVPGKHNVENSLACIAVCLLLDVEIKIIKEALEEYKGVERRMQQVCHCPMIIHDYAHHPTEIESTIAACSGMAKNMIVIFQPHTYSRTRDLYEEFLSCFEGADEVWLLPIYPAREKPIENITSQKLAADLRCRGKCSRFFASFEECKNEIVISHEDSLFLILGAGDIEKLAKMFAQNS